MSLKCKKRLDKYLGGQQVERTEGSGAERQDPASMLKSANLNWNRKIMFRIVCDVAA